MAKITELSAIAALLRYPPLRPLRNRRTWACSTVGRKSAIRIFRHLQTPRVELCDTDSYRREVWQEIAMQMDVECVETPLMIRPAK